MISEDQKNLRIIEYLSLHQELSDINFLTADQKDFIARSQMSSFAQVRHERPDKSVENLFLRVW